MEKDKETRNHLIQSARKEFSEKGYMKASLRTICKNAGVTTGALYFFFKDKDDLFDAVAGDIIHGIYDVMQAHFQDEKRMVAEGKGFTPSAEESTEHMEATAQVIHQMYLHREDVLIALTKSQGTKYENVADWFIETAEKHYRLMADVMMKQNPEVKTDDKFIHWLAHQQIDTFIYMITHIDKEKDALPFIRQAVTYMMAGWYGIFLPR
ncbi:MAG: TetR family transcriptional regulator [Lachnospiraceae bacterium]|nr:TetR family transcriptional regulator [Lachnospiraceae bacterium]